MFKILLIKVNLSQHNQKKYGIKQGSNTNKHDLDKIPCYKFLLYSYPQVCLNKLGY